MGSPYGFGLITFDYPNIVCVETFDYSMYKSYIVQCNFPSKLSGCVCVWGGGYTIKINVYILVCKRVSCSY